MKIPGSKNKKGFTLVEVIISIAALGLVCAVLLKLFVLSKDTNETAGAAQEAELFASAAIESLACADSLEEGLESLGLEYEDGKTEYTLGSDEYSTVVTVEDSGGGFPGTLYDISVSVEQDGRQLAGISTKKYEQVSTVE